VHCSESTAPTQHQATETGYAEAYSGLGKAALGSPVCACVSTHCRPASHPPRPGYGQTREQQEQRARGEENEEVERDVSPFANPSKKTRRHC